VCAGDAAQLDGKYTVFGQVIEGNAIIDQIVSVPRDRRNNPDQRIEMQVRMEKRDK
jgi:peptidyl-prolyl cis-trans isomerase B (cyclophilin B)